MCDLVVTKHFRLSKLRRAERASGPPGHYQLLCTHNQLMPLPLLKGKLKWPNILFLPKQRYSNTKSTCLFSKLLILNTAQTSPPDRDNRKTEASSARKHLALDARTKLVLIFIPCNPTNLKKNYRS